MSPLQIKRSLGRGSVLATLALALSVTACQSDSSSGPREGVGAKISETVSLSGAGASFPSPLYQKWFIDLNKQAPNLQVSYQSVGSGAGVKQFTATTVDFGASDVAMDDEEISKVSAGTLLLPMTAGSVVLAYNLPGVESGIKLSRQVYVDILLGKIKNWNDAAIKAANPDVNLPDQAIQVVYRSDGSGTTGVFTKHLSAISPDWKDAVGEGKSVSWPTGVGAKGNEGVTAQVLQTPGAIGYIEYGYAKQNDISVAALENKAGQFIIPDDESAAATLAAVTLPENLRAFITDPEGEASYPIVTYSWMLAYKEYSDPLKAKAVEAMVEYGLTEGQKSATELGYIPLPANVVEKVAAAADQISPDYTLEVK